MEKKDHLTYRPEIDGLRAISVLLVVLFHAFPTKLTGGFVGVDVFFVISGYLISRIIIEDIDGNRFRISQFYYRRILRIFPALLTVIITVNICGLAILLPAELANLGKHTIAASLFSSNLLLFSEISYFDATSYAKPLRHLWSLGIEEQFYIIWPIILVGIIKIRRYGYVLLLSLLILSFGSNIWLVYTQRLSLAYLMPFSRFWELMMGALLAFYEIQKKTHATKKGEAETPGKNKIGYTLVCLFGIALILASAYFLNDHSLFPGVAALAPTIGAMCVIHAGNKAYRSIGLSNNILVGVGKISYPLYLWHWPLISMLFIYTDYRPGRFSRVIILVISLLLAIITYRFIEKKVRTLQPRLSYKKISIFLVGLMTVIGIGGGYFIYAKKGLLVRFPEKIQPFLTYKYDYEREFRNDTCLLSGQEAAFSDQCLEIENMQKGYPLIFIWGDSHAAQLYRSVMTLHSKFNFALGQFTSSSCPPIANFNKNERPLCKQINDDILSKIAKYKPKIVVLSHDWPQSVDQDALRVLPATVTLLKTYGVEKIILVGPVPHWNGHLSSLIARRSILFRSQNSVPRRLTYGLDNSIIQLNKKMAKLAADLSISYVNTLDTFCNSDGCMVVVDGDKGEVLTTFDDAHLTFESSMFLVKKVLSPIIASTLTSKEVK